MPATRPKDNNAIQQAWSAWEKLKRERGEAIASGEGDWAEDWWDPDDLSIEGDFGEEEGWEDEGDEKKEVAKEEEVEKQDGATTE